MKLFHFWGFAALITAILACTNPFHEEPRYTATTITSVKVTPPSGRGSFTLEVSYETFWIPDKRIPNIHCYYVTPGIATVEIGVIDMLQHIGAREIVTATGTLPFTVSPINGVTPTGNYLAGCTTETNTNTVNTNFTVIGEPAPPQTFTPESASASTPTPQPATTTLKGRIIFDYSRYQSDRPSGAGELDMVTSNCIPEVTITPDGVLSGTCEYTGPTPLRTQVTTIAHVTGIAVQGGSFNFTYEVTEKFPNGWGDVPGNPVDVNVWSFEQVRRVFYTGSGNFTSATQASGEATFDFSCDTGADNLIGCWKWPQESFSGRVPWGFATSPE